MKRLWTLMSLMIALLFITACGRKPTAINIEESGYQVEVDGGTYTNISTEELKQWLDQEDLLLINVHIPDEGNIPDTDLSIPFNEVEAHLDQLPADKEAQIVLYCRSGRMSEMTSETLVKLGYTNVVNVEGGMIAWQNAGYDLD